MANFIGERANYNERRMARIVPVILCGGSGTRLWPLSRASLPKQFLRLLSERTLLQETVLRLGDEFDRPIVVCNDEHRFIAAEQLREIGCAPQALLLEPVGRNTAPAAAAAALTAPDATLALLAADHFIDDAEELRRTIRAAAQLAASTDLVVFGIKPSGPETGYGYIKPADGNRVERFVEKPTREKAEQYVRDGYLWNSGMFVFSARAYLEELGAHRAQMVAHVERAVSNARRDLDFVRLDREAFTACPSDSIDYAVMEKTRRGRVLPVHFGWSDIGSFDALWRAAPKDAAGNVVRGDVAATDAKNCYLHSEDRLLTAIGVQDLVVVETTDAVLVAPKARAQDIKQALSAQRSEHLTHPRVYRPWGYYEALDSGTRFQVKRLMIHPGGRLSLQRHRRRAEHWVVVSGHARITLDERTLELGPNQSTYIPQGARHRLENDGKEPLLVIEVQSGDYFGEDDIERFADDYKRD
jgi:mannose-1-phosphate guanylyltransferase / mannose-6-phosphate isomerase